MSLFSIETYGELQPHDKQEWLLTNGLGGFASGTVVGMNTRRYHGTLVAATLPPVGRILTINRIGEILCVDGKNDQFLEFSVNAFHGNIHPRGDRYLRRFDLDETARWEYEIDRVKVVKEILVPWMKNITGIRYTATADDKTRPLRLMLLPFTALRDFHGLRRGQCSFAINTDGHSVSITDGRLAAHVSAEGGQFIRQEDWWFGHKYPVEAERGQDDFEDLYTPGRFIVEGKGSITITLWASVDRHAPLNWDSELKWRRTSIAATYADKNPVTETKSSVIQKLARAANDFIVYRKSPDGKDGSSIIAGYPWFADWGRDTMISLPGLMLVTGRFAQARQVLSVFAQYVSQGMIPNVFDDYSNEPHYNTVDASLWFVHACFEYARLSGDNETFNAKLRPACEAIIRGYREGTRFHIKMDPEDGLITQGDVNTQLTWMDAKCNGIAFTPRQGKAVEINALWFNALVLMGENDLAKKVAESFRKAYWIGPTRGLADVVDGSRRDTAIRPNQIFAASLPHSPLTLDEQSAVVKVVEHELLTPFGLRTLAASDPNYKGYYSGPQMNRDGAYHNGTVWPWPIGAFLDAYLKVNKESEAAKDQARLWLKPLLEHMEGILDGGGCVGQIAEIFEGEHPHRPVGTPAQAWSIAEVLRLALKLGM